MGVDNLTYRSISFSKTRRAVGDSLAYLKRREHADSTKSLNAERAVVAGFSTPTRKMERLWDVTSMLVRGIFFRLPCGGQDSASSGELEVSLCSAAARRLDNRARARTYGDAEVSLTSFCWRAPWTGNFTPTWSAAVPRSFPYSCEIPFDCG